MILEFIESLPNKEKLEAFKIRSVISKYGDVALKNLNTRQLKGKLWEIKFSANRIMYIIADADNIYFLHACKKQKNKAEKQDLAKAISRARLFGINI